MTKRPRSRAGRSESAGAAPTLRREAFPAVRALVRGYLHQDFQELHGSLAAAARAFRADASVAEREQLMAELESLAHILASHPARKLRQFITDDLGSGWAPKSHEELTELLETIRAG